MAPRILGPRRTNISAPHSRSSATRTATLSCEVISLGATQVQWLRQVSGKDGGEADDDDARAGGRKTVVVFDYVFEVRDHLTHQKLISIELCIGFCYANRRGNFPVESS